MHGQDVAELEVHDRLESHLVERHHENEQRAPRRHRQERGQAGQHQGQGQQAEHDLQRTHDGPQETEDATDADGVPARDARAKAREELLAPEVLGGSALAGLVEGVQRLAGHGAARRDRRRVRARVVHHLERPGAGPRPRTRPDEPR